MKKTILVTSFAAVVLAASAQVTQKEQTPKPPVPPKPPVEKMQDVPPPPPPPDPPPPPMPPELPNDFNVFLKRNPSVKGVQWRNDEMIIRFKSGKEERYNLNDEQSRKDAEAKYGELPQVPPPPPAPPAPPRAPKKKSTLS